MGARTGMSPAFKEVPQGDCINELLRRERERCIAEIKDLQNEWDRDSLHMMRDNDPLLPYTIHYEVAADFIIERLKGLK